MKGKDQKPTRNKAKEPIVLPDVVYSPIVEYVPAERYVSPMEELLLSAALEEKSPHEPIFVSKKVLAEKFGIGKTTIRKLEIGGHIQSYRPPKTRRKLYNVEEVLSKIPEWSEKIFSAGLRGKVVWPGSPMLMGKKVRKHIK